MPGRLLRGKTFACHHVCLAREELVASLVELLRGCDAEQVFKLWRTPIVEWIKTISKAAEAGPYGSD